LFTLLLVSLAVTQAAEKPDPAESPSVPKASLLWAAMDYGPFLTYTVDCNPKQPEQNLALKGITIHLGQTNEAAVCFDTDLMRYAAGWTDGFLDLSQTHLTTYKGSQPAFLQGLLRFSNRPRPGWANRGEFADPRVLHQGPLPGSWAKYRGLYRHGDQIVLAYTVGGIEVLDLPGFQEHEGISAFTRIIRVAPTGAPMKLVVCDWEGELVVVPESTLATGKKISGYVSREGQGTVFAVAAIDTPSAALLRSVDGRLELDLPPLPSAHTFKIVIATGPPEARPKLAEFFSAADTLPDLKKLCQGGPARWPQILSTQGQPGIGSPYVVDTLTIPEKNPWQSWMRLAALDFFSDGRAAVSTWNGDLWIVSGIDEKLNKLSWKRFAAGLFEPLGLKIVSDQIYILGRDQITRLHDLNHDGEADFYENFNNDAGVGSSYHAFAFDLQTDKAGNFYYIRCGQRVDPSLPLSGGMVEVASDGSRTELIAHGLRAANGMSIGPNDEITCADNQGNWIPSSRLNLVKRGGFYGYVPHAHTASTPTDCEKPICWLPMIIDNSSGGQVWVTSDMWGPFKGHLLHTSYGKSSLFHVLMETVDGQAQGGVVRFPLNFDSGIMRARFNPRDGQLYVCGLNGWQTTGARDGALQRVRYTGGAVNTPLALRVWRNGIQISFTGALDTASASDEQNYAVSQWNYKWTKEYGSPEFSVVDPDEKGHDAMTIKSVKLSADRKTVLLEIPDLQPVMQMKIQMRIKAADGSAIATEIYNTINRVPEMLAAE
jgi:glucose/arabinose dehydrogenase